MKKLSKKELELINKALMSYRWQVEKSDGQDHPEFTEAAQLMDKLAVNNENGAEIKFL